MKVSIVFFAASITVALAGCPTKKIYNQPNCLPKSEYDPYWQRTLTFTSANGPCFKGSKEPVSLGKLMLYKKFANLICFIGTQMCFVNKGWLEIPCECSDSACGCSASFAPQCSGAQVFPQLNLVFFSGSIKKSLSAYKCWCTVWKARLCPGSRSKGKQKDINLSVEKRQET